ncbi:MAG: Ig-like domain-containing protein [Anaerolineales bacterium]
MEVEGPADLVSVTFKVDDAVVATVTTQPFRVDFETDDYGLGWHTLTALRQTGDGRTLMSNERRLEFVAAEVGWRVGAQIAGIVGASVAGIFVLVMGLQLFLSRRAGPVSLGAKRNYGWLGGAVCPKCGRPFVLHLWGLNAVGGKFDRCDHCGQWSLVRRASPQALAAAGAAEVAASPAQSPLTPSTAEERLRKQLDDTRYIEE